MALPNLLRICLLLFTLGCLPLVRSCVRSFSYGWTRLCLHFFFVFRWVISGLYPRNTTAWANCRMTYAEPGALQGALGTADTSAEVVSRRCIARAVFFSWDFRSGICKGMSLHYSGSIPDGIFVRLGGCRQETNRWREEFRLVNATLPPATRPRRRLEEALEKTSFFAS